MSQERKPNPYDRIPQGPRSDLGQFLYQKLLKKVMPGLIATSAIVSEYAVAQKPKVKRQLRGAIGRLSRISAEAASGKLQDVNFPFIPFESDKEADAFAAFISKPDSELFPVPSSVTHRLHSPLETALDGVARQSKINGLTTLVTEVTAEKLGSTKRYFTVRLVGRSRLNEVSSEKPNTEPSN